MWRDSNTIAYLLLIVIPGLDVPCQSQQVRSTAQACQRGPGMPSSPWAQPWLKTKRRKWDTNTVKGQKQGLRKFC